MPLGLSVALALAGQAAPAASAESPETSAPATPAAADGCRPVAPNPETIVVCGERPQGYRIDPDILTVKRMKGGGGRPTRPGPGGIKDTSPCVVGPQGCPSAGINLIGAALTAAEMAKRVARGEAIGNMFITDPQPSEYQLYVMAKRTREAAEADKAAKAKVAQMRAEAAKEATEPVER